jgi:hypothetical protein
VIEEDVARLRRALEAALEFSLDFSGKIDHAIHQRTSELRYRGGVPMDWGDRMRALAAEVQQHKTNLILASPSISSVASDLDGPLREGESALDSLQSALRDFEIEQSVLPQWEKDRDRTLAEIEAMRSGDAKSATCGVCGMTFMEKPTDLGQHFKHHHHEPARDENRLVPVSEQMERVEAAGRRLRSVYETLIKRLSSFADAQRVTADDRSRGGRRRHPWQDAIRAKTRERWMLGYRDISQDMEAELLLDWARERELPTNPESGGPKKDTVVRWIRDERAKLDPSPDKPSEKP